MSTPNKMTDEMTFDQRLEYLNTLPDDQLSQYQFALVLNPSDPTTTATSMRTFGTPDYSSYGIRELQQELWHAFQTNPQISSAVRDYVGRMTGYGFEVYSEIPEIQEKIDEITYDYRNRLHSLLPKYVGRAQIEGELFLVLTLHNDGFVEIDFRDPSTLDVIGYDNSGIIYHPRKPAMPIAYQFKYSGDDLQDHYEQIPSIYVARYPELVNILKQHVNYNPEYIKESVASTKKYNSVGGFKRFVVQWDKGWMTARNISYIRTVLTWVNLYEQLKTYEINHKKSSGAYLWVLEAEDIKTFRAWMALTEEQRAETGIMKKKDAGGTLVVPPGMKLKAISPTLPKISDSDTDVLDFVTSGLNTTEDSLIGRSNRNKSSLSQTHGTQRDRTFDEIANFERFLKFDLWGNVFFLASAVSDFKYVHKIKKAVDFNKSKKPVFKFKSFNAERLIGVTFPQSHAAGNEETVRALLGSKHGPVTKSLGIPASKVGELLGFGDYRKLRLQAAEEQAAYPELTYGMDEEAVQEKEEAENSVTTQENEQ
jgi:hypothetical protein